MPKCVEIFAQPCNILCTGEIGNHIPVPFKGAGRAHAGYFMGKCLPGFIGDIDDKLVIFSQRIIHGLPGI
jgi:hypothetical protein